MNRVASAGLMMLLLLGSAELAKSELPEYTPSGQSGGGAGEIKSTDSWRLYNSAADEENDQHVFEIVFTGLTSSSTQHQGAPMGYNDTVSKSLCVPSDVRFGKVGSNVPTVVTMHDTPTSTAQMLKYGPFGDGKVPVHLPTETNFVLNGRTFYVIKLTVTTTWSESPPGNWTQVTTYDHQRYDLNLEKLMCTSMGASIDTRKAHGQPNLEGELPGDANAEAANVNFANWIWKGGLFAGNIPITTGDQSGLSRMQFRSTTSDGSGTLLFAVMTLFYLGSPAGSTGNVTFGAYVPASSDSNLNQAESGLTWANRWNILPEPPPQSPSNSDWSKHALKTIEFTSSSATQQYYNWGLKSTASGAPVPWTHKSVCLAIDDETHINQTTFRAWRYFASRQYESDHPESSSNKDWAPRIWAVRQDDYDSWGGDL
jgi:hypothetical protein